MVTATAATFTSVRAVGDDRIREGRTPRARLKGWRND